MIELKYHRGVHLPELGIWLDPWDPRPFAFVSHAHSDHTAFHEEIIATESTARLMQERIGGQRREHILEFGKPRDFTSFQITLLPAGHILGSAQSFIETDKGSLLYTGDFKLRPGLSAEPTQWCSADTLIMETTYGLPKYCMPPTETVIANMVEFCKEALEENAVPVLLGYSLGKSQEILCALMNAGLTPMLHGAVFRMTEMYRKLRPDFPAGFVPYAADGVQGKVLICPPSANRSIMLTRIKNRRTAMITGWALDSGAKFRYQCDAAFPLTDHADYPDLIRYVELVKPKRILTLHGFAAAFAADLRNRGWEAWALSQENQLEFGMNHPLPGKRAKAVAGLESGSPSSADIKSEFHDFALAGERISTTASKLKKIEILREYLISLNDSQLLIAAIFLTGKAFPQNDPRILNVGWSIIRRALMAVTKISESEFRALSRHHNDAGKTTFEVLLGRPSRRAFSLPESFAFFDQLQKTRGPIAKTEILQSQLESVSALEGSYLVRILTGDLRIGLKEGLVEEAIAATFGADLSDVKEAHMLLGDIGETALRASQKRLDSASLRMFAPIKCMLASPETTAEKIWARIETENAEHSAWAEDKFDGIRAQLHIADGRVEIFSRDLRNITGQFADLVSAAANFPNPIILDGEILAFEEGKRLTFFDLQKRLGRKSEGDLFHTTRDVPVIFQAFDLLFLDGESLLKQPLQKRRALLESVQFSGPLKVAPRYPVASADDIERAFHAARLRKNEGLMIKDAASFYTPGRRGMAWLKLKKELATLDVVVIGAESGHGKRSHVLSDYTFAIRDDTTGNLLTIGKAYSGLTDVEIEKLTEHFQSTTISERGNYREVQPDTVLEIAFDSVQPSKRHNSGLALRFPRIKAIRTDKTPEQIDTLKFAMSLVATAE